MTDRATSPAVADQPGSTPASPGVADGTLEGGASNPIVLNAVRDGTPEATSESVTHAAGEEHHEAYLGLDSYGWVGLAFLVFALLLLRLKVPAAITGALDSRAARIRAELEEARRLRVEAESLHAEYQAKLGVAEADAARIRENAHAEARRIAEAARVDAEARVVRRAAQAEDRIAAAERAAETELRARAATLAAQAAARVIATQADDALRATLANRAIEEVARRL